MNDMTADTGLKWFDLLILLGGKGVKLHYLNSTIFTLFGLFTT